MPAVAQSFAPCCVSASYAGRGVSVGCLLDRKRRASNASAAAVVPRIHMISLACWSHGRIESRASEEERKCTYLATWSRILSFAIRRRWCAICSTASSALPLIPLALVVLHNRSRREVTNRRQARSVARGTHADFLGHHRACIDRLTANVRHDCLLLCLLPGLCLRFGGCSRLRQELLEITEKVRSCLEQVRDLAVYVLDRLRFALIGLKDLQELLVDVGLGRKAILSKKTIR